MPDSKPIGSMRTRAFTIEEKLKSEFDSPLDELLITRSLRQDISR